MTRAGRYDIDIRGHQILLNGKEIKIIGVRCSNALISDDKTAELIENLDRFRSYGVNTVAVYFMGSRFGDVKGYLPDASLDDACARRMGRIIEAADDLGMIVLVGCLYWGDSRAKEDLDGWQQAQANRAVANTVRWLGQMDYRNVIVDPDNEGMASRAMGWRFEKMIQAGKEASDHVIMGYNNKPDPPDNADILLHFSPTDGRRPYVQSEGTPRNAPGNYWGAYSKQEGYHNYIRVGRYTEAIKRDQIARSREMIEEHNGYVMASTWLQCAPHHGVGGPFMTPGGLAGNPHVDENVKAVQEDAGILWWLQWVKDIYGPWTPPE